MAFNPFEEKLKHKKFTSGSARSSYWKGFLEGGYYHTPPIPAETQKARGIFFLMNKSAVIKAAFDWRVPKHLVFRAGEQFNESSFNFPVFARPCPVDPRHGFVDSIPCKTADALNALSDETKEEESDAELLVTKPINASYSAILTDGVLTFSGGNDGATSGRNVKYFYVNEDPIAPAISLDPTILLEGEVPFYEFVMDKAGKNNLVQVRSAPGVPKCKDYIPERVTVEKVIKAEGDLLLWEKLMHECDPATTIVDHTNGSLSSHYAIHAIINRIPIFTSYLPEMGEVVEATVHDTEINDKDRDEFFKAFCYGFSAGEYMMKNSMFFGDGTARTLMNSSLQLALACLHNFSSIAMSKDYEVVGITLGLFVRSTFVVSSGESRHAGGRLKPEHAADLHDWNKRIPKNREACYNWMYKKDTATFLEETMLIYRTFNDVYWGGGYGGPKWASCTRSSFDLFNACVNKDINSVVELFNQVLHEEHNGGKYLNKVINVGLFDEAANNPSTYALKNMNIIIDMLSTVWAYADSVGDENIPWDAFKPIDYKKKVATKKKPIGRWEVTEAKVFVDGEGTPTHLQVTSDKFKSKDASGKLKFAIDSQVSFKEECGCCQSVEEGWHDLYSVPYYWQINDTTIISKSGMNGLLDNKMGLKKKKVKPKGVGVSVSGFPSSDTSSSGNGPTVTVSSTSGSTTYGTSTSYSTNVELISQLKAMLESTSGSSNSGFHGGYKSPYMKKNAVSGFVKAMQDIESKIAKEKAAKESGELDSEEGVALKKSKAVYEDLPGFGNPGWIKKKKK